MRIENSPTYKIRLPEWKCARLLPLWSRVRFRVPSHDGENDFLRKSRFPPRFSVSSFMQENDFLRKSRFPPKFSVSSYMQEIHAIVSSAQGAQLSLHYYIRKLKSQKKSKMASIKDVFVRSWIDAILLTCSTYDWYMLNITSIDVWFNAVYVEAKTGIQRVLNNISTSCRLQGGPKKTQYEKCVGNEVKSGRSG